MSPKTREALISKILAYDLVSVLDDADKGDLLFLEQYITGDGISQLDSLTGEELRGEFDEGDYDGPVKQKILKASRHYDNPRVQSLLKNLTRNGAWDGRGKFHAPGTAEYKRITDGSLKGGLRIHRLGK